MPLPWKKSKVTRISKLVADLQSPKHGGSLVVETGFPTSLVDLFVKNRARLKKNTTRRKRKKSLDISGPISLSTPPAHYFNPCDSDGFWGSTLSRIENLGCQNFEEEIDEIDAGGSLVDDQVVDDNHGVSRSKETWVIIAVLVMFMVVILAFGTKMLAVAITMSTFALLILEYAGNRGVFSMKPCSDMQMILISLIRRLFPFVLLEQRMLNLEVEVPIQQDGIVDLGSCDSIEDQKSIDPIEEVDIVETNLDLIAPSVKFLFPEPDVDMLNRDERWRCAKINTKRMVLEEEEDAGEVFEHQLRSTRSAKLKAKVIKKFVPKKFRGPKKGKKCKVMELDDLDSEVVSYAGEDKLSSFEEQDEESEDEVEKLSGSPSEKEERCEGRGDEFHFSEVMMGSGVVREKVARETQGNSGYLILVLIALAGLVGGHLVALSLTLVWYYVLKSIPKIRSSV